MVEWHKPPSVRPKMPARASMTRGNIRLSVPSGTCTSQRSPFHRSLQRRQRVNSSSSLKTSPYHPILQDVSLLSQRHGISPSSIRKWLFCGGRTFLGIATRGSLPLLPIYMLQYPLYKSLGRIQDQVPQYLLIAGSTQFPYGNVLMTQ